MEGLDPQILQDFLTESGELLAQLETDLVELERAADDAELVNQVFRALHTIKGSASFLSLTNLVTIAHAAESALNAARNHQAVIDRPMMDRLLQVVDLLKEQFAQIQAGRELTAPDPELVESLKLIGDGKQSLVNGGCAAPAAATPTRVAAPTPPVEPSADAPACTPLVLGAGKAELFDFLVADTVDSVAQLTEHVAALADPATRGAAANQLVEACEALARSIEFFEFASMTRLVRTLGEASGAFTALGARPSESVLPRLAAIMWLVREQTEGLAGKVMLTRPIDTLVERTLSLARGEEVSGAMLAPTASAEQALATDGVLAATPEAGDAGEAACSADTPASEPAHEPTLGTIAPPGAGQPPERRPEERKPQATSGDQTIRVEVNRLETLMNLVGELVLQKNRLAALIRKVGADTRTPAELREGLTTAAGGLDRITSDMQVAVLRTRMQPLDKLFGKYPRLIRDLSSKTGKQIDLIIEGGDTEVDKSVIEELGDPLVHLMRNAADHGLESPADREAAGKSPTGTIRLIASNEGGHVSVQVKDDGRGLLRERIGKKAVERGLVAPEALAQLSDREVFRFIFLPGFSTADQVSDLSGRGVGMDVVRTNIQKLKGTIDLWSEPGKGTTVAITLPLTVAIMPAMMVGVSREIYAVPLTNILEIVRPEKSQVFSIGEHPVLRLRDSVLPLISAAQVFDVPAGTDPAPFAVILQMNEKRFGLMVTRLIGQQEIVIKSLDQLSAEDRTKARGPIAGATVRDDGGVSLIADVAQLLRIAESRQVRKAA
jgi:two-component system chemotaxis sensor kinase CheA